MKPVDQTKMTALDYTIHGNCLAACLASLLEMSLNEVPVLEDAGDQWADLLWDFLQSHGYELQGSFYPRSPDIQAWWPQLEQRSRGVAGFYIAGGKSHRTHVKRGHAVLYQKAMMVHDPHPSRSGLLSVDHIFMIEAR